MKTSGTLLLVCLLGPGAFGQDPADPTPPSAEGAFVVKYLRCPDGGVRPIVERDATGGVHIVYHGAFSPATDLFYIHSVDGGFTFSDPVRVNGTPGGVDATDFSRGADLAVGRDGMLHVAWMGSEKCADRGPNGEAPLVYTRRAGAGDSFAPERNLIRERWGLTAAPSLAADANGAVHVFWHAPDAGHPEDAQYNDRVVCWSRSLDDGETFSPEERIDDRKPKGVAENSSTDARVDEDGTIYVLYRSGQRKQKDMRLLYRPVTSERFGSFYVDTWRRMRPPEATSTLKAGFDRLVASWETEGEVYCAMISRQSHRTVKPWASSNPDRLNRTRCVSTFNANQTSILAWMEGEQDAPPTHLEWRLFDNMTFGPIDRGSLEDVPPDAVPDVFVRADEGFTIVY